MPTDRDGRYIPDQPAADKPMKRFYENIDRETFASFLDSSGNDRYEKVLLMIYDPAYASITFAKICQKAGVTLHEMQELYTNGMRQLALLRMSTALPELMADVAEDAKSRMENCTRCDGFGFIPSGDSTRDCPTCKAVGSVRRVGDKQARELVFESAKMIRQSGPLVAIQQNFSTGDSHLESILKRTREIALEPPLKIIDKPIEQ